MQPEGATTEGDGVRLEAPGAVRWIVRTLEEAGHETWAVGGAVRDALLGIASSDWDVATAARPKTVRRLFRRTVPIGIEHGTVGVLARDGTMYEVTTFRKDVETDGRHAVVAFADRVEDDLSRRDFTLNAVAWHPLRNELRDPFQGLEDLERRLLRTVGAPAERFAEDYLRILRGLRFAGRFDLTVDPDTWRALCRATPHLPALSPERIREELEKVLEKEPRPSGPLALYAASGALTELYPELDALVGTVPETGVVPDLWTRALLAADRIPASRPLTRLAALLMDVGVPERVPGQGGGDAAGVTGTADVRERAGRRTAALLTRLRFSNADRDRVTARVRSGPELPEPAASPEARRRWLSRVGAGALPELVRIAGARARIEAAAGGEADPDTVADAARALRSELGEHPPISVGDLALDGGDLIRMGLRPGPAFGDILEALLDRALADPGVNRKETLEALVREEVAPGLFDGGDAAASEEGKS